MTTLNPPITLSDLPDPPLNKTGWPWTEQPEVLSKPMLAGSELPRISIVTPSYNYGRFLEETIRSVLLQDYPNVEYIIIDGGSTDNTSIILQKYSSYLTYWVSKPDNGQTDAINKGYQHCTGDIFVWLNADDAYKTSSCLRQVAELYRQGYELIAGGCSNVDIN
ncbi:MAG: glycosyltransferase, partial [Kovacikia sp.]